MKEMNFNNVIEFQNSANKAFQEFFFRKLKNLP